MISSTPLRKSLNRKQPEDFLATPLEAEVDDDHERRKRRSVYHVERSLSSIPDSNTASSETIEQIVQHIKACQKLCHENKINVRNAWDIKVIDYIYDYVSKNTILDPEVILEGARMLEISVKVYGYKVDYLSQEVVKLANVKEVQANKENSIVDENCMQEEAVNGKRKKQKTKRRQVRSTTVKEKKDLLLNDIPKAIPIDFIGNVDVYASSNQNMFTNKVLTDHTGYRFNLLNEIDHGFISYDDKDPTLQDKLFLNAFPAIKSVTICLEFKNFHVDEEDQAFNDSLAGIMNASNKSKIQESLINDVFYDDGGAPVPELDGSIHDVFADNITAVEYDDGDLVGQIAHKRVEMITSFCPAQLEKSKSANVTVLHGSNGFLETVWVGPSHWKNKRLLPSAPKYSGKPEEKDAQVPKRRRTSNRQVDEPIDLSATPDIDFESLYRGSVSHNIRKHTLPPNGVLILPELDELILRRLVPKFEYQQQEAECDFEHSPYDYDNANDSQYCSQIDLPEVDDHPGNDEHDAIQNDFLPEDRDETVNGLPQCLNTTEALIDAPDVVTQEYVPYARRAKNVNMRKLKAAMVECMTTNQSIDQNDGTTKLQFESTTFSEVLKKLPAKLSKKTRNDLSVPLAFFSLLHLANEHNLKLIGTESLDELHISQ